MPLTKSEFDRWKAQRDEAIEKIRDIPRAPGVASIDAAGFLRVVGNGGDGFEPEATRSLYEMLRAWYGESSMTETLKELLGALTVYMNAPTGDGFPIAPWGRLFEAFKKYTAEQAR